MQLKNIEFLKQFREEDNGLPHAERQYGNVYFRHFNTVRKEKYPIERFLEKKVTHSGLIGELVVKMEREDQVIGRRLSDLMLKLQRVLTASCSREAYPPQFVAKLSVEMGRFNDLAALYWDKMQSPLLSSLRDILSARQKSAGGYLDSGDIRYIRNGVRAFLDDIYYYYAVFARLLEEEYGRTGASAVTSPAEEGLLKLTTLMKGQIFAIEATVKYLNKWGKGTREVELQGIYN